MQMILLGTPISADEALSAGLVSQLFEAGAVLENAIKIASRLAALSPTALSLAKEAVSRCGLSSDFKSRICSLAHKLYDSG
jgi:enoyl-CoA hydratase/carnithine racemase